MRVDDDAIALGRGDFAREPRALSAEVAEDVDGTVDLAARLRQRLAFLARHLARDVFGPALEQSRRAKEDLATLRRGHGGPRRLRRGGGLDGLPRLVGPALRVDADHFARVSGVAGFERAARCRTDPVARDEIRERLRHRE